MRVGDLVRRTDDAVQTAKDGISLSVALSTAALVAALAALVIVVVTR